MIARGFKPVGWVAGVAAAALGCYMLSLQVAAERADLADLERQIVAARQNIRSLQTELGTRGRLSQLEQWNADVLALSAPVSGQYLESEVRLARFDVRAPTFDDRAGRVQLASAPAAAAATAPARPDTQPAVVERPIAAVEEPAPPPLVRRASLITEPAAPVEPRTVRPPEKAEKPSAPAKAPPLLDAHTLQEIGVAARAERDGD